MPRRVSRREFLGGLGVTAAAAAFLPASASLARALSSQFRVAVINDEIGQDFDHVCSIVSKDFGMHWIELRGMWNKNIVKLDSKEINDAHAILDKYKLQVTDIASPLFKVDWPGAPKSKYSPKRADSTFEEQDEVLERSIEAAKAFKTDRIRGFDFWRIDDQAPYRAAMNQKLIETADKLSKKGLIFLLENEPSCNTATAAESVKVLDAVKPRNFMLNWDPGNAATHGEVPYPDGYNMLPKERIGHCHCKDAVKNADGQYKWAAMGSGIIDWVGQFKALKSSGYRYAVSLETHWRGAGTPEESSRQSWAGMKQQLEKIGALSA